VSAIGANGFVGAMKADRLIVSYATGAMLIAGRCANCHTHLCLGVHDVETPACRASSARRVCIRAPLWSGASMTAYLGRARFLVQHGVRGCS